MNRSDISRFLRDGNILWSGGMQGGIPPSNIARDQSAYLLNATVRGGSARPRPGWFKRPLQFPSVAARVAFQSAFFQEGWFYKGDSLDSLLSSHGGRQFQIQIDQDPGVLTVTSANFTIPANNFTVPVTVASTAALNVQTGTINIGQFHFQLITIDSPTQITVKQTSTSNVGTIVASGASVQFLNAWSVSEITPSKALSTTTVIAYVGVPAPGGLFILVIVDATGLVGRIGQIVTVAGFPFTLISVDTPTVITVRNDVAANTGITIPMNSVLLYTVLDVNNPNTQLNWSEQPENYWVLQDNQSYPIIFDGTMAYRSDPAKEQVPIGNVMCYAMGRLSVALPDRKSYRVGDLVFDPSSGTAITDYRDAVLYFTANNYTNEGGDFLARVFGAPSNSGEILAMKAGAMTNSALGQGPMQVGTPNVVFTVNLPFDRTIWKNLANALQTVNPIIGPCSQRSTILVNTDLWYRAPDGVRSYLTAERQFNGSWGNTAQSLEVNRILSFDTQELLEFGSGVLFDNRALFTCSPQMSPNGCYHRGLVVLDFDLVTGLRDKLPPCWEGIWSGLRILKLVSGIVNKVPRCFIYVLNDDSQIELWELSTDAKDDGGTPIAWTVATPAYSCGDTDAFKKLKTARLIVTDLVGTVTCEIQYRSDESSCWNDWTTVTRCAAAKDCGPYDCIGPKSYSPQTRYPIRLTEPPDEFDDISGRNKSTGFVHQLLLNFLGHCRLDEIRVYLLPEPENLGIERDPATET